MKRISLDITSLAHGGAGVGRHEGKVCFVPFTAPGDRISATMASEKKSYSVGSLAEILVPSPLRTVPLCPLYGDCGGCSLQHLSYDAQVAVKRDILQGLILRNAAGANDCSIDVVPSPTPYGYRSRIQLKVHALPEKLLIGFYRRGSHRVVDLPDHCPIASSAINDILPRLRQSLSTFDRRDRIPQVDLAHGDDRLVHLTFHCLDGAETRLEEHLSTSLLDAAALIGGIHLQTGRKSTFRTASGEREIRYAIRTSANNVSWSTSLSFAANGFSQVNAQVNSLLVATLAALAHKAGGGRLLDLYCGNGNLSLPLAPLVSGIEGVEEFAPSILSARTNAALNGITHARFHTAPAETFSRLPEVGTGFDMVILDPPREGAKAAVEEVIRAAIPLIFYISCDPATLARDAGILQRAGYVLDSLKGFDMFPQTHHIEALACFRLER